MINITEREIMKNWKGDIKNPKVSICCITYNHEKYIEDALDSFLMQKTDFPFEIVIDDDCSIDKTPEIIRKYKRKFPNIIKENLREHNIGAIKNFVSNMKRANGEYIALCEGDDYWTDENKLQMQFEALEKYEDCSFCGHDVVFVDKNKNFLRKHCKGRINENWQTGIYDSRRIISAPLTIPHTSSLFFKKTYIMNTDFFNKVDAYDYPLIVLLATQGKLYYINKALSAYRQHDTSLSYSRDYNRKILYKQIKKNHYNLIKYFNNKYKKEIRRNLKGHFIMMCNENMKKYFDERKYFKSFYYFILFLLNSPNSQYSVRDVLWIMKNEVLKKGK